MLSRRARGLLALLLGAAAAACDRPSPPPQSPPTVDVARPLVREVADWDDYSGRFEPVDLVEVRPRVSGTIQSVHFQDGQRVRQGQLLFVIDPRPIEAQLARARADREGARAQLANADAELKRARALVGDQLISQSQLELRAAAQLQASADLAAAEAAVQSQELNLSFTRVTAPLAGRASWRRLAPGNVVTADTTVLTTLVTEDPIRFVFDVPESALLRYKREAAGAQSSPVEIRLQDETDYRWKGRIDFLDNALDRSSGTIRLRAVVPNPDGFLAPGMFGQMRLFAGKPFQALLVPDQAIVTDQTRQVIYVVDEAGRIAQRVVRPGRLMEGLRVIHEGLAPEDRVVISGVQRARPGRQVTVVEDAVTAFPTGVSRGEDSTLTLPPGDGQAAAVPAPAPPAPAARRDDAPATGR